MALIAIVSVWVLVLEFKILLSAGTTPASLRAFA